MTTTTKRTYTQQRADRARVAAMAAGRAAAKADRLAAAQRRAATIATACEVEALELRANPYGDRWCSAHRSLVERDAARCMEVRSAMDMSR